MSIRTLAATSLLLLGTTLPAPCSLAAQETVDLPGRDQHLDADFEEVFTIGVVDGEDWEMLGTVMHVAFDGKGNLYIVDGLGAMSIGGARVVGLGSDGMRVLVFDASGNFLRQFGSSGEGPGEFSMPTGFAVTPDGTTIVADMGHRAYQLFDADGAFLRMVRASEGDDPGGFARSILADPRGGAVFTGSFGDRRAIISSGGGDAGPPTSRPIARLGLGGEVVRTDTVVEAWLPPRAEAEVKLPANLGVAASGNVRASNILGGLTQPLVFEPPLLAGVLPNGGIVHSDSSAYELKVTPPDAGEAARVIRRPLRPEPVTPRIEKDYLEEQEAARGGGRGGMVVMSTTGGSSRAGSNQSFSFDLPEPEFYPEIPILRALVTTWEGRIWVQRRGDEPESDGPIDVIAGDGRYVGTFPTDTVEMPNAFGPNGMAAFIERDDFDVARVVVRRLPAAVR